MFRPKNILWLILVLTFVSHFGHAQCPYTSPPFNRDQVNQLCNERASQQTALKSLSDQLAKIKIEMITVKSNTSHHVGNIYAVLVGGNQGGHGGVLVPIIPAGASPADQSVELSVGISTPCSVVLHFNQQQDYIIRNNCAVEIKAVVLFSATPVRPED
jgi:hypothetical protein